MRNFGQGWGTAENLSVLGPEEIAHEVASHVPPAAMIENTTEVLVLIPIRELCRMPTRRGHRCRAKRVVRMHGIQLIPNGLTESVAEIREVVARNMADYREPSIAGIMLLGKTTADAGQIV